MEDLSGRIVKSYQITDRINIGGFGIVYRAFQPVVEREVALKVILPYYANETEFIRRFEVEAQIVARLEHPYIVPLYDFWRDPEGAYLVMRLMRGGSLRDVAESGAKSIDHVLKYVEQITAALAMAHRQGIIHRDIKPENILLDEEGNAFLTDFGIAQRSDVDTDDLDSMAGSVNYIAPEMIRGDRPVAASDVYSLGIMVFELLTGRLPFDSQVTPAMIMHHLNTPFPDIRGFAPHLPDTINQVLQRACAKQVDDRYETVREFAHALREVSGDLAPSTLLATTEMYKLIDNPYKGLRPFDEADSQDFFGRDALVSRLIDRFNEDAAAANFLAVVGPSGSGKSSVVRAGLIPRMRFGEVADTFNWFIADFVPGDEPIANLANALLSLAANPIPDLLQKLRTDETAVVSAVNQILANAPDGRILLFIDQFEEVFTLTENEAIRLHLLNMLSYAIHQSPDIYIIVTIRADFFDKPLLYEGISELMQARTQVVLPLTPQEIERAITGPAENVSLIVDRELIAAIISDVREEPGALPLLQYTLTELFERRETNRMTLDSYVDSGGVLSSLARRAEEVYDELSSGKRKIARQIFLRLVTLGEGTEDTRRRVRRSELFALGQDKDEVNAVLDEFGKYRLLTFDRDPSTRVPTVEIAHEALIKRWDDLRYWLDESRNDVRLQRSLATAAQEWLDNQQRAGYLLFGARLLQYEEWFDETTVAITAVEGEYLEASVAEKQRVQAEEQQRQEREAALQERVLNRTRIAAIIMAVAVVITIGLAIAAINQSEVAQKERDNAEIARATSDANAINAEERAAEIQNFNLVNIAQQSVQNGDTGLAVSLLETVSNSENLSPAIQSAIYDVAYTTQLRGQLTGHSRKVTAIAISPDGLIIATGSEDLTVILWDATTGESLRQLIGHRGPISDLAFSPDGTQLVSVGNDATIIVWDVVNQTQLQQLTGHRNVITGIDFAPDGNTIVTASGDDTLIIWDIESGEMLHQLEGHSDSVRAVAFSPDGQQIISASRDTTLILWDANTGMPIRTFTGHNESVQTVAFSSNGQRILSGSFDGSIILWDVATGINLNRFVGHSDEVTSISISPDNSLAVSASCAERDTERTCIRGDVLLWDMATGRELRDFVGHGEMVNAVIFSPEGNRILSGSCAARRQGACITGETLIWDVSPAGNIIQNLSGHASSVFAVAISSDNSLVLSGGGSVLLEDQPQGDTSIILWDATTGQILERFDNHTANVTEIIFHPDNQQFVSSSRDRTVRVTSLETGEELRIFEGHTGSVYDIEFNSDATMVLSAGDNQVLYWNFETFEILHTLENFGNQLSARALAITPDDTIFATGLNNGVIILWNAETGEEIRRLIGHTDDVISLEFSSDGTQIVSGSADRSIRLWNVETGREIRSFNGHRDAVTDVDFSFDYRHLLSASEDGTMRYWDVASGEVIRIFEGHTDAILDVNLSDDSTVAYSASADGRVIGWRISLDAVIAWLTENRFTRALTADEIETFQLDIIEQ